MPLSTPQYAVIKALVNAYPKRPNKDELIRESHREDARKILKRLAGSSEVWNSVIDMAGTPRRGYGLVYPS